MATATYLTSRKLSRRDHVLNLLPPLTVVNKEDATMHDRLFANNPPAKNYPENFPSKVLRHLGAWTFYSAPTKGELALLDKNMYDLDSKTEKTDAIEKKQSTHTEYNTEEGTQSHSAGDGKKSMGTTKSPTNKAKHIQQKKEERKKSPKETNKKMEQKKPCSTAELTPRKLSESNSLQKTRKQVSENKNNKVEYKKKTGKPRRSSIKCLSHTQQKNTQVNSKTSKSCELITKVEITLKKSRGKVLGGAETGTELGTEALAVEGHNMPVPGPKGINGSKSHNAKKGDKNTEKATRVRNHPGSIELNTTEEQHNKLRKSSQSSNCDMYTPVSCDSHAKTSLAPDKTQSKHIKRSVIKIPLQENESPEDNGNNNRASATHTEECNLHNKVGLCESEKCVNEENHEMLENLRDNSGKEIFHKKHVTFGEHCEKEPVTEKKRSKSQIGHKKEHKRSGKHRVKTS